MRLKLDRDRCVGHARCVELAPALFDVDDEGFAVLLVHDDVPRELESDARLAAENCPEGAIASEE
jgi:ferredoxin